RNIFLANGFIDVRKSSSREQLTNCAPAGQPRLWPIKPLPGIGEKWCDGRVVHTTSQLVLDFHFVPDKHGPATSVLSRPKFLDQALGCDRRCDKEVSGRASGGDRRRSIPLVEDR